MTTQTVSSLRPDLNVRATRIYPVEDARATVGIRLSADQARKLALLLLTGAEGGWADMVITGHRAARADGTYQVTLTHSD